MHRKSLFIALVLMVFTSVFAGDVKPLMRAYNQSNGLPTNTIYELGQDSKGYLWLAHEKGLSRFDGLHFKHYYTPEYSAKAVSNLIISPNDDVYCQGFSGEIFHVKSDSLYPIPIQYTGTFQPAVWFSEKLLIPQKNQLSIFDASNVLQDQITFQNIISEVLVFDNKLHVFYAKDANFSSNLSCQIFDKDLKQIQTLDLNWSADRIYKTDRNILFFKDNTVFDMNHNVVAIQLPEKPHTLLYYNDLLYAGTNNGLIEYSAENHSKQNTYFTDIRFSSAYISNDKTYFIGTLTDGFLVMPETGIRVLNPKKSITTFFPTEDKLWVGTNGNSFGFINDSLDLEITYKQKTTHPVYAVHVSDNGDQLMAGNPFAINHNGKTTVENIAVKDVAQINDDLYLFAFSHGAELYSPSMKFDSWLTDYFVTKRDEYSIIFPELSRCRAVFYDKKHERALLGFSNGAQFLSPTVSYKLTIDGQPILITDIISNDESLIFCTQQGDIFKLDHQNRIDRIFRGSEQNISLIEHIGIHKNQLYFNTSEAFWKINETGKAENISQNLLLPQKDLVDFVFYRGNLWLAYHDETLIIPVAQLNQRRKMSLFAEFTQVYIQGKKRSVLLPAIFQAKENSITLSFSVPDFSSPEYIEMGFVINETDTTWLPKNAREIALNEMAPGEYHVRLISNQPLTETAEYRFEIQAPIYARWWFVLLISIVIAALIWFSFQRYLRNVNLRNKLIQDKLELEKNLESSMLRSIKAQMNPHFLFNALNTIQSYIYTNDKERATTYLAKFSNLTRMILEMSNHDTISLADEIKSLKLYLELEKQRFGEDFHFEINADKNLALDYIQIPPMLVQPYVENAIKHGLLNLTEKRELKVIFRNPTPEILEVEIDDNGVGREMAEKINLKKSGHNSFSSEANHKRLSLLNHKRLKLIGVDYLDKKDEFGNSLGTRVTLRIPNLPETDQIDKN